MRSRGITLLAILQMAALVFGILFTVVFRKIGLQGWPQHLPDAPLLSTFLFTAHYIRYGFWLGTLLVVAWVLWASHAQWRSPASAVLASGAALFAAFVLLAFQCCIWASKPVGTLLVIGAAQKADKTVRPPEADQK